MNTIRVEAPARLHLGMFDLGGSLGRRFGGLGAAVSRPAVMLQASLAGRVTAEGPGAARAGEFARRYLAARGLAGGVHLSMEQVIPEHVGLGSGTKLGLAVAQALAALYDQPDDPYLLAGAVGRGHRSAVGVWTFKQGGLVVEGGQWPDRDVPAPLLLRYPLPSSWSCVLAIPDQHVGLSGETEAAAFAQLGPAPELAARISHLTLMSLLPALVEANLPEFGAALTELQRLVGESFSPVQGGEFSNALSVALVEGFLRWGAAGAGQSSWGPAVYAFVDNPDLGRDIVSRSRDLLAGRGWVDLVAFDNQGVRVGRE